MKGKEGGERNEERGRDVFPIKFRFIICSHTHTHTHTCTMIPFELYSFRKASEKWLSNLYRREGEENQLLAANHV